MDRRNFCKAALCVPLLGTGLLLASSKKQTYEVLDSNCEVQEIWWKKSELHVALKRFPMSAVSFGLDYCDRDIYGTVLVPSFSVSSDGTFLSGRDRNMHKAVNVPRVVIEKQLQDVVKSNREWNDNSNERMYVYVCRVVGDSRLVGILATWRKADKEVIHG